MFLQQASYTPSFGGLGLRGKGLGSLPLDGGESARGVIPSELPRKELIMPTLRLGVDIGGTFTDHVLYDEETGQVHTLKTPSTPHDLSLCALEGIRRFDADRPGGVRGLDYMAHGTTVNTNAILERKGALCGLITTHGFRDVLEIGRQTRPKYYDWYADRPVPLVPRYLRLGVKERVNSAGEVVVPLDEDDVYQAVETLRRESVQAVAVCLLNSYANPAHERRIREILQSALPGVYLAISSELSPEFREFERSSTTAAAAYVGPTFERYVERLSRALSEELDPSPRLYIMQSSGGMVSSQSATLQPHLTIESGPAAGVLATAELGRRLGIGDLISFDMGGTTAKASLIRNGNPSMLNMLEVGGETTGFFGVRITGLPIKAPSIDLVECSAGGGSIVWTDVAGLLKVGPESAGAVPGPACYDTGGTEPTVTDAHVVLGRIAPEHFLGGQMSISGALAEEAVRKKVGEPLGMELHEAAHGILDVVNANMVRILRVVSVTRGFDPRSYTLVAYGGAGPLHAGYLAQELGIGRVIIPPTPGLFSAMGLVSGDIQISRSMTRLTRATPENLPAIQQALRETVKQCEESLDREQVPAADRLLVRSLDMRYVRQNFELEVPLEGDLDGPDDLAQAVTSFHQLHDRSYGQSNESAPVEVVNVKARGSGNLPKPELRPLARGSSDSSHALTGTRRVFFTETGWTDCPDYDRESLLAGNAIPGPAIVHEFDSSIVILPGHSATVGDYGDIVIET